MYGTSLITMNQCISYANTAICVLCSLYPMPSYNQVISNQLTLSHFKGK